MPAQPRISRPIRRREVDLGTPWAGWLGSGFIGGLALSFPSVSPDMLFSMRNGVVTTPGRGRAMWYAGFAVYAAGVALFSGPGLDHWWGAWAAGGYAVAAVITVLAARRARGPWLAIAAAVAGALVAPAWWL